MQKNQYDSEEEKMNRLDDSDDGNQSENQDRYNPISVEWLLDISLIHSNLTVHLIIYPFI